MSTLTKKQLVIKSNTLPSYYYLTESGRSLAFKLLNDDTTKVTTPSSVKRVSSSSDSDECSIINNPKEININQNLKRSQSSIKEVLPKLVNISDSESSDDIIIVSKPVIKKPIETNNIAVQSIDILTTLPPGSYEIILIVDTCETSHA